MTKNFKKQGFQWLRRTLKRFISHWKQCFRQLTDPKFWFLNHRKQKRHRIKFWHKRPVLGKHKYLRDEVYKLKVVEVHHQRRSVPVLGIHQRGEGHKTLPILTNSGSSIRRPVTAFLQYSLQSSKGSKSEQVLELVKLVVKLGFLT